MGSSNPCRSSSVNLRWQCLSDAGHSTKPVYGTRPMVHLMHNDSYMSDTYPGPGLLGKSPEVFSTSLGTKADPTAIVVVMTFDSHDKTENH